jgi:DNA polymerase
MSELCRVTVKDETSLDEFREHVRALIGANVPPRQVEWRTAADGDLFGATALPDVKNAKFTVPSAYVEIARDVLRHRDPQRFAWAYELLWRLLNEDRMLLSIFSDPLVYRLKQMQKAVHRDLHKMTAFVRFRKIEDAGGEHYVAWFEPQHLILNPAAEFFERRFAAMRWSILTPDGTLHWDRHALTRGPGVPKSQAPSEDGLEDWWLTYYRSTFNPARANPTMLRAEMPKKYWKNLPEAALIPDLLAGAGRRAGAMVAAPPTAPRRVSMVDAASAPPAEAGTIAALREEARACERCLFFRDATQTVFGEGPTDAPVVFVGEQPGDQEDLAGKPFVGPAGQLFDRALAEAGVDRARVYVTNAVKHFKFTPRGKKRIHAKPNGHEIEHCRWWLDREIDLIKPKLIVALGATAVRSLTGKDVKITQMRGRTVVPRGGLSVLITVHPSYLLRLPDAAAQREEFGRFVADLAQVTKLLPAVRLAA